MKKSELIFRTRPDRLAGGLAFQRITHILHENTTIRAYEGDPSDERAIRMPQLMARRILSAATILGREKPGSLRSYNCHRFTRAVGGFEDDFAPLRDTVDGLPEAMRLPLGAIGLHYAQSDREPAFRRYDIVHSVVGLGEDLPDALQVFSRESEFGFADISESLAADSAQRPHPVRLYRATDGLPYV